MKSPTCLKQRVLPSSWSILSFGKFYNILLSIKRVSKLIKLSTLFICGLCNYLMKSVISNSFITIYNTKGRKPINPLATHLIISVCKIQKWVSNRSFECTSIKYFFTLLHVPNWAIILYMKLPLPLILHWKAINTCT